MKHLIVVLLASLVSLSANADMDKKECKQFKKENKMVMLGMTKDQAFCIVKKAKLVAQYTAKNPPYVGQPVATYQYVHFFYSGISTFSIIDGKVVRTSKI